MMMRVGRIIKLIVCVSSLFTLSLLANFSSKILIARRSIEHQVEFPHQNVSATAGPMKRKNKPRAVVIVGAFRTGSSFTGQLFNQNPNIFYLFEPLYPTTKSCHDEKENIKLLTDLLTCNFNRSSQVYLEKYRLNTDKRQEKVLHFGSCAYHKFCTRHKSRALCDKEFCSMQKQCKRCPPPNLDMARSICKGAELRVIKVIRVCDVSTLESLSKDVDLKIIYLVRDPRSTALSRKALDYKISSVGETCNRYILNHQNFVKTNNSWLKNSVMFVRYEDILMDPVASMDKMYSFVGAKDSGKNEVLSWIRENSFGDDHKKYGTRRNSKEQLVKWRYDITMQEMDDVQSVCATAMDIFGYEHVRYETQLKNISDLLLSSLTL